MDKSVAFAQPSLEMGALNEASADAVDSAAEKQDSLHAEVSALEQIEDEQAFDQRWSALAECNPDHLLLWKARGVRLIKRKLLEDALDHIRQRAIDETDEDALIAKVELLYDAQAYEEAEQLSWQIVEAFPDHRDFRLAHAKRLFVDGFLVRSHAMLEPVHGGFGEHSRIQGYWERVSRMLALLERLEGRKLSADQNCRIIAMKHAILHFRDREPRTPSSDGLGRLTLVTGSLGPGGAERQLTRLAVELERSRKARGKIAGIPLQRPVEVLVRSHGPEKQSNFYLGDLQREQVELHQINLFEPVSLATLEIEDDELSMLLDYLPPSVNFGVKRLTPHLLASGTDTLSVWQDGACLFAGLAALVAGVPQVQLAIRGLPPSMRRHMFRPEYEVLYRALAEVPGVTFLSNNIAAARAYSEWLDIPLGRFSIVYNGVEPMQPVPSAECDQRWQEFAEATADATHTIGGVFRFDTDKQPTSWIRFAARYLRRHPETRFLLVGGGRLLDHCRHMAEELGIAHRILFTDRSTRVGYWMTKMDVLVLLSRYEGLPNVLIEAQYMGVRVVTTPAGGAAECLIDGTTGHVLDCAEKPNVEGIVEAARDLALKSHEREIFEADGLGRAFLDRHFSIPHMLAQFVTSTVQGYVAEGEGGRALQRAAA